MDESIEPKSPSVQFSVRTLLLITTNAALLAAIGQISNHALADMGQLVKCYGAMLTIYGWRFVAIRASLSSWSKWKSLLISFAACLPYVYLCIGSMFYDPFGLPLSKWIGAPIWIYTLPLLSFMICDLNDKWCSPTAYLIRSLIEIVVLFQVWSFIWAFGQLFLGWAWI